MYPSLSVRLSPSLVAYLVWADRLFSKNGQKVGVGISLSHLAPPPPPPTPASVLVPPSISVSLHSNRSGDGRRSDRGMRGAGRGGSMGFGRWLCRQHCMHCSQSHTPPLHPPPHPQAMQSVAVLPPSARWQTCLHYPLLPPPPTPTPN